MKRIAILFGAALLLVVLYILLCLWHAYPSRDSTHLSPREDRKERRDLARAYLRRINFPLSLEYWDLYWDTATRNEYIRRLGYLAEPETIEPLRRLLDKDDYRCSAAEALARIGDVESLPLLKTWADKADRFSWCVRTAAAEYRLPELESLYLRMIASEDGDPQNHGDVLERSAAARALGNIRSAAAYDALSRALEDFSPEVRRASAAALSHHRRETVGHILDLIEHDPKSEKVETWLEALVQYYDQAALSPVPERLEVLIPLRWDTREGVRHWAMRLTDQYKTGQNSRQFEPPPGAADAIAATEKAEKIRLMAILTDPALDPFTRRNAAEDLSVQNAKEAIPILIQYTAPERDIHDRRTGYSALARFNEKELRTVFEEGEKDGDEFIRFVSAQARRRFFGLREEEQGQAAEKLLDYLARQNTSPQELLETMRIEQQLDLSSTSVLIRFVTRLENLAAGGDAPAAAKVMKFLGKQDRGRLKKGVESLPFEKLEIFFSFLSSPDYTIRATATEVLSYRSEPGLPNKIFTLFLNEADPAKKVLFASSLKDLSVKKKLPELMGDYLEAEEAWPPKPAPRRVWAVS